MNQKEIEKTLDLHRLWLCNKPEGKQAIFDDMNLENVNLRNSVLSHASFQNSNLTNAIFEGSNLESVNFDGADLTRANMRRSNLKNSSLNNAILKYIDFEKSILEDAIIQNSDLLKANLQCTNLYLSRLEGTNIEGADIRYVTGNGRELKSMQICNDWIAYDKTYLAFGNMLFSFDNWARKSNDDLEDLGIENKSQLEKIFMHISGLETIDVL